MTPGSSESLERQIGELRARLSRMEDALRRRGIVLEDSPPAGEPAATAPLIPAALKREEVTQPSPPVFVAVEPSPQPSRSLESRIGSQWFNRVGILAVLIGVAWFLKLAFDNHWVGPLGRVLIGLVGGAALIGWSEAFEQRGYVGFSYSLKAIGTGTLYLSIWAAFSLYALLPPAAAFAAMILVTAFNGFMAWIRNAELLAFYAIVGGLSTPLLVSNGGNHEVSLFTYLLILDLAVLVLVILRPWSRLLFVTFLGTVLFIVGWWFEYYSQHAAQRTAVFLACFFVVFAVTPRVARFPDRGAAIPSAWDALATVVLPLATAGLSFLGFYNLMDSDTAHWAAPWLAVAFAAFYLLLLRVPARGVLRENPEITSGLHLAITIAFLTIAIPLKTHGRWLTIGWLAEGAALLWVADRLRSLLIRACGVICLGLGLLLLLLNHPEARLTPIFNQRFATFCFGIGVFAFAAWLAARYTDEREQLSGLPWRNLAATAVVIVNALILIAIGLEIHSFWWLLRWRGDLAEWSNYQIYAQFTYSALFMLFGAALLAIGFWRRSAFFRWQALVLLAVSIGKVFLWDVRELSQGFRILSFLGLGALLLAVSFAYQRDWLNLRGQGEQNS